ncbi:MAG: cell wall-binding repeat-containing protein [Acidimicrobiaceae bacterium]|nr:cell wall-binding repeat-containing protein [Acidimicrobiaceae bacterium]
MPTPWSIGATSNAAAAATTTDNARTLVVALATSLSDVGTASSLVAAGEGDAVLFAESIDSLGAAASIAAARWQPERVLIVGGTKAVSDSVEHELRRLSADVRVTRLAGNDRIHTAALAADRVLQDRTPQAVIIANGWSLPDVGVAASAVASGTAQAVLYAGPDDLGEPTRSVLARHRPPQVLIAGGPAALSPQVQSAAADAAGASPAQSRRLGGATRVETAALVAAEAIAAGADTLVLANGWSLHDVGLAAALAAALPGSAVAYTAYPEALGPETELAIDTAQLDRILLVGDETALSTALVASLPDSLAKAADTLTRITSPTQAFYAAAQTQPPERFIAVSGGTQRTCGLRDDHTAVCWSPNLPSTAADAADAAANVPPPGRYATVPSSTVGPLLGHSCALRLDSTLACWGANEAGQSDPPEGTFTAVAAGGSHSCALRQDSTLVCWGANEAGQSDPPEGTFTAVAAGGSHSCALRQDSTLVCWGANEAGQSDPPEGTFTAVAAGHIHSCALRDDQTVACWGDTGDGRTAAPPGTFLEIDAGGSHSCGIRTDHTITCWGSNSYRQSEPPPGPHSGLSVGGWHACALSDDRTASCWGNLSSWQMEVPAGRLAAVSAGSTHTCGLRDEGTIVCHGYGAWGWPSAAPSDGGVATQAVYAVPDGESPVSTRPEGISDSVKAAQAWFRSQAGGRHPVFERDGHTIDVKALRVGPPPSADQPSNGVAMAAGIQAALGLAPYAPLLVFVEGKFGSATSCGWKTENLIVVPIGNCDIQPEPGARWPYGATYIIGHEVTHLLGAAPACAPNHDGSAHVNDDNRDVIWLGPKARDWDNLMLDVGHDDYFMHGRDDCFDISNHPLLRTE